MYSRDHLMAQDKAELQRIALAEHGEELKPSMAATKMVERIIELQGGEGELLDFPEEPEVIEAGHDVSVGETEEPKFKVRIFEERGESPFVDLAVNGHALRIQRGSEVVIAKRFVDLLSRSVQTVYEPSSKDGKVTMVEKEVPRFNFTATPV